MPSAEPNPNIGVPKIEWESPRVRSELGLKMRHFRGAHKHALEANFDPSNPAHVKLKERLADINGLMDDLKYLDEHEVSDAEYTHDLELIRAQFTELMDDSNFSGVQRARTVSAPRPDMVESTGTGTDRIHQSDAVPPYISRSETGEIEADGNEVQADDDQIALNAL